MALHKWFIPHKDTHKKAHLISWEGILIYVLFFIFLQVGFSILSFYKPGILGVSSNISQEKIIELTNKEREKYGLKPLSGNMALSKAAQMKAGNMFEENYWAHFAPSGKTPWDFILGSGYKFTFAGENLAKNFYNPEEVVAAWMASPTHKDNLLNPKYHDIGIAVVDGVLNGQKTTLVIQMFGTTQSISNSPLVNAGGNNITLSKEEYNGTPQLIASVQQTNENFKPLLDPYQIFRTFGLTVILFMGSLLIIDLVVLKRRGVLRVTSNHWAHMALLSVSAASILLSSSGSVL